MKKGYKVTDVRREKKIGIAAENLQELVEKSCKKLGVSEYSYLLLFHDTKNANNLRIVFFSGRVLVTISCVYRCDIWVRVKP